MEWREIVEHPSLKDLPFKIETNERGQIIMTPATDTTEYIRALLTDLSAG